MAAGYKEAQMMTRGRFGERSVSWIPMLLTLILLVLASAACGGRSGLDSTSEGSFARDSFTNEHGTRDYRLYVPSGYEEQRVPLIVMLHGCGQDAEDFAAGTRMNALGERETAEVSFRAQPSGSCRCPA